MNYLRAAFFCLVLACNTRREAPPAQEPAPALPATEAVNVPIVLVPSSAPDSLPLVTNRAELERYSGQRVRARGIFDVERVEGESKAGPLVYLSLADGTKLIYLYVPDELSAEQRGWLDHSVDMVGMVSATGRADSRYIQQLAAPHIAPETITPNEATSPRADIPAAPTLDNMGDLLGRPGRWVRAVGTLVSLDKDPSRAGWGRASLSLEKDAVTVELPLVRIDEATPFVGGRVVVVGRVIDEKPTSLGGPLTLCAPTLPRCPDELRELPLGAP